MCNKINSMAGVSVEIGVLSSSENQSNSKIRTTIRIAQNNHQTKVSINSKKSKGSSWKEKNLGQKAVNFQLGLVSRREFIDDISSMILFVPKNMKCHDYDVRYDFYLEIISNIEKIIKLYNPEYSYSFQSWFISLLKKRFISFMRARRLKYVHVTSEAITDMFDHEQYEDAFDYDNPEFIFNHLDFSNLNEKEVKMIKAKYGIYSIDEIKNNPMAQNFLEMIVSKEKISNRIARKYTRLLDIQHQLLNETNPEKLDILKDQEAKLIQSKRILEEKLSSMKTNSSIRCIANYFDLSKNTVNKYIQSAERKIYKNNIINL